MWIEELDNERGTVNCCNSQKKAVRMGHNYKVTGNAVIFASFLTLFLVTRMSFSLMSSANLYL